MQISDDKSKKSVSSLAESVESGKISSSSSEWKIGSDKLFVTFLNDNSESNIKPINNYLDLFINTTLNHMSIRSCLVSPQLFNANILSHITFGVILHLNLHGKISTNSQNDLGI